MSCGPSAAAARAAQIDISTQAVIQGTVVRGDEPVRGAYVRLLDRAGEFTGEVATGQHGDFRFFARPGDWTVRVLAPGASPTDESVTAAIGTVSEVEVTVVAN